MEFRRIRIYRRGDILEVKLIDTTFNVYFKGKADINNKKQMEELKDQLRCKGVSL